MKRREFLGTVFWGVIGVMFSRVDILVGQTEDYYSAHRKKRSLKSLDRRLKSSRSVLPSYFDEEMVESIMEETRIEFENLISEIPHFSNKLIFSFLNYFILEASVTFSFYRVLKKYGMTVEEIAKIVNEAYELTMKRIPGIVRRLVRMSCYSSSAKWFTKKIAEESQKRRYPDNWVMSFVEGDGEEFDYGIDFTECAICKFLHVQDADELSPFMCMYDYTMSRTFGLGLEHTMTIANGDKKCNFRFKKGRAEREGWPPEIPVIIRKNIKPNK